MRGSDFLSGTKADQSPEYLRRETWEREEKMERGGS